MQLSRISDAVWSVDGWLGSGEGLDRRRQTFALLLSLLVHILLLGLTFGEQGVGLPGFGLPWQERRIEAPDVHVRLMPSHGTIAEPVAEPTRAMPAPPPAPAPEKVTLTSMAQVHPVTDVRPVPVITAVPEPQNFAPVIQLPLPKAADTTATQTKPEIPVQAAEKSMLNHPELETKQLLEAKPQDAAQQSLARVQATQQEIELQEAERADATRQELARVEAARLVAERDDAALEEAEQQDIARLNALRAEAARQEAERIEASRQESALHEAAERLELAQREFARLEAARLKALQDAALAQAAARQEAAGREAAARQEAALAENMRQEAVRAEKAPSEAELKAAERQEAAARREARLQEIGRQLNEEADQRAAAASNKDAWASTQRRGRLFGRSDLNAELVFYGEALARKIQMNTTMDRVQELAKQPHTQPIVTVAIRSDGSVESVVFVRTSGVAAVDEAISHIVRSQANYPVFPPGLIREYDVIEIRRTWVFDTAVRLQ